MKETEKVRNSSVMDTIKVCWLKLGNLGKE